MSIFNLVGYSKK